MASRTDPSARIREETAFFGSRASKLFGCLHRPLDEPFAGVVICCPFQAELQRNYRREVLAARDLAAHGIAVQRFHYRGAGHSDGDTADLTLDSMREDALEAAEELARRTGVSRIAFLGTRFGAMVAASAAAAVGTDAVLWQPVIHADRYFDEVLRFRLTFAMKEDPSPEVTHGDLMDELLRTGSVDILGHLLERRFYDGALGRTLLSEIGDRAASVLLAQIGVGRQLRREFAELAEDLRARGFDVESHAIADRETWWISGDLWRIHETHGATRKLLELTREWALRRLREGTRT